MSKSNIITPFIIPAIDLLDGQVVRLFKGRYHESTVYQTSPTEMVQKFIQDGAKRIHIVDLNAARNGDVSVNRQARNEILLAAKGKADLEIGGGVRDESIASEYLQSGFRYIIIGTAAVKNPTFLQEMVDRYGPARVIVGVDAEDGLVKLSGWEEDSGLLVDDYLNQLAALKIEEIIFTDISTDGTLAGPPIETLKQLLLKYKFRLVASGGISSLKDIEALLKLNASSDSKSGHLSGIITGKAIYENKIDLAEAVKLTL
ncbi:MAG: 1-(5-phosphoribosyl)-5-[(5-phosphoribosylamino)methylideneamino]imidazole-4-carboxamide isomerase [Leptonema sp. (in: Bacteria)]|nr:1-(5-phosphoribosyl)-5-[(5-phosphoribosylamino)methylideneamino]imidazole-4-carboxamide isomerase [Leptonema sp. (in: bacteria)]